MFGLSKQDGDTPDPVVGVEVNDGQVVPASDEVVDQGDEQEVVVDEVVEEQSDVDPDEVDADEDPVVDDEPVIEESNEFYAAYVGGKSIQSIADENKVEPQEVINAINEAESKR